jgi:RHS repeat-associated protein
VIVATSGGASTRYVQVQGQILAQYEAGAWGYVLLDHLGSMRQLVDAAGQVTLAQSYDPFGVPFETSGSGESEFGYTGEWWDAEAELLYLRARYYDPYGGVLVQKDSFLGIPLSPSTMNGFNYANQNPVNLTDRSGYSPHGGDPIALCLELPACRILLGMGGSVVGVTSSPVLVMLAVPTGLLAITYFYCGPTGCAPDPVIPPGPVPEPPAPAPPRHPPLPGVTPMPPFPDTTGTGEDPFSLPPIYQRAPEPEPAPTPPPFPIPVRRPTPPPTCTSTPEPGVISYRGLDGEKSKDRTYYRRPQTNPGQFRLDPDGVSTFELAYLPGNKPYAVGFRIQVEGLTRPGSIGPILNIPFSCTGTYTPQYGEGHWSINCVPREQTPKILSTYAKQPGRIMLNPHWTDTPNERRLP